MEQEGILILATPRCAGTNISKGIASYYNKEYIHEPNLFNTYWTKDDIIKVITNYSSLPQYTDFFNKIILIDRRDTQEQIESLAMMYSTGNDYTSKWNSKNLDKLKYSYPYVRAKERIDSCKKCINLLSKELDKDIEYTEDILKDKKFKYSNIQIDSKYLLPELKLRNTWDETTI